MDQFSVGIFWNCKREGFSWISGSLVKPSNILELGHLLGLSQSRPPASALPDRTMSRYKDETAAFPSSSS